MKDMKIQVTLKDPDALEDQIGQGVVDQLFTGHEKLTNEEVEAVIEKRKQSILDLARTWFEYGEYLVVEIDTDKKTIGYIDAKDAKQTMFFLPENGEVLLDNSGKPKSSCKKISEYKLCLK